jgi:TrmH family RNA methyltransferase
MAGPPDRSNKALIKNVEIVLVSPRSPGNIGSVARAMKNTGFKRLVLVDPVDYMNDEARLDEALSMACNAGDILKGAGVFSDLPGALKGSGLVVGATRRKGKLRTPLFTLDEAALEVSKFSRKNRVSILFGREDKGLKNEELSLCDILFEIPSHKDYPSLNLSHAVFALCYRLFTMEVPVEAPSFEVAPREDIEKMYVHLERALKALGYAQEDKAHLLKGIMRNLRRLLGRTGLMEKEVKMLRGIFTRIEGGS